MDASPSIELQKQNQIVISNSHSLHPSQISVLQNGPNILFFKMNSSEAITLSKFSLLRDATKENEEKDTEQKS